MFTNLHHGLGDCASSYVMPYQPPLAERNTAHWSINGFPATIFIWTEEEWRRMDEHPADAQYYPCGIWCALRLDPPE